MLMSCKNCNTRSDVTEIQELDDIEGFSDRILIIGVCTTCNKDIALLVETRTKDNQTFYDRYHDEEAIKVIKREKKRIKNKSVEADITHESHEYFATQLSTSLRCIPTKKRLIRW